MKTVIFLAVMILLTGVAFCHADSDMKIYVDGVNLDVEWEDNDSVKALRKILPLTVEMSAYGGFEQVGNLGRTLPRNDTRITTKPGDIVLYSGNQIVIFHGTNSWAYTRLGRITGITKARLAEFLDKPGVTLKILAK